MQQRGTLIWTPLDGGSPVQSDTVHCCHCGVTWIFKPGSGRRRGKCGKCNDITCGKPECDPCRPYKKLIEEGWR